jgi:hypothetical protein
MSPERGVSLACLLQKNDQCHTPLAILILAVSVAITLMVFIVAAFIYVVGSAMIYILVLLIVSRRPHICKKKPKFRTT